MKLWTTKNIAGTVPAEHAALVPAGGEVELLNFRSTDLFNAVNDVEWSPKNSTSFAAAMDDGRVELWDLSETYVDPLVVHYPKDEKHKRKRTCVRFSANSPVLIAGDDKGCINVMRMHNAEVPYYSMQEQQDRLNSVMTKKR